jgi:hypothetical protein
VTRPALALALLLLAPAAAAWEARVGGDARLYQFLVVDPEADGRRDAELGLLRLTLEGRLGEAWALEAHGLASLVSPTSPVATSIVAGTTRRLLDLEATPVDARDVRTVLELDRLNVRWQRPAFRLVVGRQAITWGVDVFWPVLDLFAPFPPERVDRDYKPGVDALRLTVPLGPLSELDLVAAGQGSSLEDDGSLGALVRVNVGPADVGAMLGRFHRDTVAGGFVTANVRGTGLRGEVAFTDSGDPADARLGRERFWRAGAGLDRQLTPTLTLTAEASVNGHGVDDPRRYPALAATDRVRRGEVTSLGRYYLGASLAWQVHPLLSLAGSALVNLGDGSALLLPHADWSLADNLSLVVGGIVGLGPGREPDGRPGSEYGPVPSTLYAAVRAYC